MCDYSKYKQATAKEIVDLIWDASVGVKYYFTLDDLACLKLSNDEPEGWYVIGKINFNGDDSILIKYCGDSFISHSLPCGEYDEKEDAIRDLEKYFQENFDVSTVCLEIANEKE